MATSFAAAALAASSAFAAGAAAPATTSTPPMIVNVSAGPDVSPSLVTRLLRETDDIWRAAGFTFMWRRAARDVVPHGRVGEPGPYLPSTLRIVIGQERGVARDARTPLGWIVFDDEREPQREIYLSHANAQALLEAARPVVGVLDQMPIAQREMLLARAMGRALAHELGHYLLASKIHTPRGLLQASRTAAELFAPGRAGFHLDNAQRQEIAARMRRDPLVASAARPF